MPPDTPDFAGRPIWNSHSPERSYSPFAASTASVSRATSAETTRSRVTGFTPPSARVAPITAMSRAVTSSEHWRVYSSTVSPGSASRRP